jgi:two-component system sensor histidine kinase/response regulator
LLYATLLKWLPLPGHSRPGSSGLAAPAALPPATLAQRLAGVKGLDLAQALRNVGGLTATLQRVLRSFVNNYAQGAPAFLPTSAPGQLARWGTASHSLRGACATIGATALEQALLTFEQALHADDEVNEAAHAALSEQARQIQHSLLDLVEQLSQALEGEAG